MHNKTANKKVEKSNLGQEIWPDGDQMKEIKRTQAGWAAFKNHSQALTNPHIPISLKMYPTSK